MASPQVVTDPVHAYHQRQFASQFASRPLHGRDVPHPAGYS
jgi:hypothetical protein